jgi:ribA/ribD-fused uncharacterized protein
LKNKTKALRSLFYVLFLAQNKPIFIPINMQNFQGFFGQQPAVNAFPVASQPAQNGFMAPLQMPAQTQQQAFFQPPVAPAPVQQTQPTVIFFSDAKNPNTGFLCEDFPVKIIGTGAGKSYGTPLQYKAEKFAMCMYDEKARTAIMSLALMMEGQLDWNAVNAFHAELIRLCGTVNGIVVERWTANLPNVVRQSAIYKFAQHPELLKQLIATGNNFLVYATPDATLGIGITEEQARSGQIPLEKWGQNILGNILMEIRSMAMTSGLPEWAFAVGPTQVDSFTRTNVPGFPSLLPGNTNVQLNPPHVQPIAVEQPKPVEPVVEVKVEEPKPVEPVVEVKIEPVEPVVEVKVEEPKPVELPVEVKPAEPATPAAAEPSLMNFFGN